MNRKMLLPLLSALILGFGLHAQTTVNITDASITGGQTVNWTKNNVYLLDGLVFVESGATLNIEAGTVVKFTPKAEVGNPSALVICRGARINANGTATEPIIFTAEADIIANPSDLGPRDNALWGGIVILGSGVTQKRGAAEVNVEGIPTTEPRGLYGGTNNADNSGVMRYVSIRHGGRILTSGNELNGLTLAGVGSGTTLEYIDVYANSDDGIEFFGGAPNLRYASVAFAEDDSFDWDEVYTGKGQFWFSIQRDDIADLGGELDGSTDDDLVPYSNPTVYNWTHIGSGAGAAAANPLGWLFRAGTAGIVANSIVTGQKGKVLEVQDKAGTANDALKKLQGGELKILNNLFWANGSTSTLDANATTGVIRITSGTGIDEPTATTLTAHLTTNRNAIADPAIRGISRTANAGLDPRPAANAAVTSDLAALPANDPFFIAANFKGAFNPNAASWLAGWSSLARNGHLVAPPATTIVNITDASITAGQTVNWTRNNVYLLDGLVFAETGATLNIEAGTVVKFTPKAEVGNPSALVIARGARINACGTAENPIIFTAEADDVANPTDLGPKDNALWGGIVILGSGVTQKRGAAEVNVEGIPTTEPRGLYGGTNNADNSGSLCYVSIRHGGRILTSGNELNGLTLAGVGSGTRLEYIEIYANSDDGIEFFGGAPNLKYAAVAFAEDDSFDWDEVYTGKGQFWFSIQRDDIADLGGELDGSTDDDLVPYSNPTVFNWTHIGSGIGAAAANPLGWLFRAGTAGIVANSIVTGQKGRVIEVQDKAGTANDALRKLVAGELKIQNNIFFGNGINGALDASATGVIRVTSGTGIDEPTASTLAAHLVTNQTSLADPKIVSISRTADGRLDPRACTDGSAYTTPRAALPAGDAFFDAVTFKGAFGADPSAMWLRGWSALARHGHLPASLPACVTSTQDFDAALQQEFRIYPNPARDMFIVDSDFDKSVTIEIFDMTGRLMTQVREVPAGRQRINISQLTNGMYVIKFRAEDGKFATKRLIVE